MYNRHQEHVKLATSKHLLSNTTNCTNAVVGDFYQSSEVTPDLLCVMMIITDDKGSLLSITLKLMVGNTTFFILFCFTCVNILDC